MLENADLKHRRTSDLLLGISAIVLDPVIAERPVAPIELLRLPSRFGTVSLDQTYLELNIPSGDHDGWWQGTEEQRGAAARHNRVLYARVVPVDHEDRGQLTVIQYWMFYVYNPKGPGHEGDWEAMQITLQGRNLSVLRSHIPLLWIDYAAHGAVSRWVSCTIDGSGRPTVFVAKDSHASYRVSGRYPVATPVIPDRLNLDLAMGDGVEWSYARGDYEIRLLDAQIWLDWPGRWGDWGQVNAFAGPQGPRFKTKEWDWDNPLVAGEIQEAQCE